MSSALAFDDLAREPLPAAEVAAIARGWLEQAVREGSAHRAHGWLGVWRTLKAMDERAVRRPRTAPSPAARMHRAATAALAALRKAAPDPPDPPDAPDRHDAPPAGDASSVLDACATLLARDLAVATALDRAHPARAGP